MQAAETADHAADAGDELPDRADAYRDYRDRFERARAAVAVAHVALLGRAARGGQVVRETTRTLPDGTVETETERARPEWRASTWLLERSFRDAFGKDAQRVEVTGPDGAPVETSGPAGDALAAVAERLARVAEAQRAQLPGGWDEPPAAIESTRVDREPLYGSSSSADPVDAEIVDDEIGPDA